MNSYELDAPTQRWDEQDQHQLHHEVLQRIRHNSDKIDRLHVRTKQCSAQKGIETLSENGKESAMKEMRNLVVKNSCFEEIDYNPLNDKQKNRALPVLIFMIMKRNSITKSREVANRKN